MNGTTNYLPYCINVKKKDAANRSIYIKRWSFFFFFFSFVYFYDLRFYQADVIFTRTSLFSHSHLQKTIRYYLFLISYSCLLCNFSSMRLHHHFMITTNENEKKKKINTKLWDEMRKASSWNISKTMRINFQFAWLALNIWTIINPDTVICIIRINKKKGTKEKKKKRVRPEK